MIGRAPVIGVVAGWLAMAASTVLAQPPMAINAIADNVYTVTAAGETSVFLVTPDGIVLVDPLNREVAVALKAEFEARFPERQVRYVIHSHHHADRASGASVYNATAELVGHESFRQQLLASRQGNRADYATVQDAESSVASFRVITLGGVAVQVSAVGPVHTKDMMVVGFPSARLAFAVDGPAIDAVPFAFGGLAVSDMRSWLRGVLALDFDTLLFDDGRRMSRAAILAVDAYVNALTTVVLAGKDARRSLVSVQAGPIPAELSTGPHAANRAAQLEYVYRRLHVITIDAHVAAAAQRAPGNAAYCSGFPTCSTAQGVVPAGIAGFGVSYGAIGFAVENRVGGQFEGSRSSRLFDDAFAYREQRVSVLARVNLPPTGNLTVRLVVGPSSVRGRVKGQDFVKEALAPAGGRHPFAGLATRTSMMVGADMVTRFSRSVSLVVPVRVSARGTSEHAPGDTDIHIGVGLAFHVKRLVLLR